MSAATSSAEAAAVVRISCSDKCGDQCCLETLHIVSTDHQIVRTPKPCCGPNCSIPADGSHNCVLCGEQVCGICPAANYDKSLPAEPFGRNVICKHHTEYLETHGYVAGGGGGDGNGNEGRPAGWEENHDACKGLKGDAKKDILAHVENANWTNVRVHAASIEPVGVKNETTKLKGFAVKGVGFIPTKAADVGSLRSFCSKNNIPKQRKGSKKTLADAIAAKCVLYLEAVAQGKEEEFMTDNSNTNSDVNVHFIMKRFLNVLMSTAFRPRLLQQLGRRLNKDDLEEGLKMNEEVFKFFLCEYNKSDK